MSVVGKLRDRLEKSRQGFAGHLRNLFSGGGISDEFFEELEETLILGDAGAETTLQVVDNLRQRAREENIKDVSQIKEMLVEELTSFLDNEAKSCELPASSPAVVLVVGVNGSGKTTTAAKLAYRWKQEGKNVMLVAGDTFRAAAIEQLEEWASRIGVEVIKQQQGSDPSAVFYDALQAARSRKIDVVIGDTAGRLHTRTNLMDELKKVYRVTGKVIEGAPHLVYLVVDATTGQNGLAQADKFNEAVPVSGLILTKLDGTAKGGVVLSIKEKLGLPLCYLGLGESFDDLHSFNPQSFVEALLE